MQKFSVLCILIEEKRKGGEKMQGKIHLYYGDGKGKTTAAIGLCVRACGAGKKVCFVQFLKEGSSSEISMLRAFGGLEVLFVPQNFGFTFTMDAETKEKAQKEYTALWEKACKMAEKADVLILDEVIPAMCASLVSEEAVCTFLRQKPENLEVILTGNTPCRALLDMADYITEMKKERHPFDEGTAARRSIEF